MGSPNRPPMSAPDMDPLAKQAADLKSWRRLVKEATSCQDLTLHAHGVCFQSFGQIDHEAVKNTSAAAAAGMPEPHAAAAISKSRPRAPAVALCRLKGQKCALPVPAAGVAFPMTWTGLLQGPLQTVWAEGVFRFELSLPKGYPFVPFSVRFLDPLYHPNVMSGETQHAMVMGGGGGDHGAGHNRGGVVNIRMLNDCWSPVMTVVSIMACLRALLAAPNFSETDKGEDGKQTAAQIAALVKEDELRRGHGTIPLKLYHYTDKKSRDLIETTQYLKAGGGAYGFGVYATALHPTQRTKTQMLMNNYGGLREGRVDYVVELDTRTLEQQSHTVKRVAHKASSYSNAHGQTTHEDVWLITPSDVRLTPNNSLIASWEFMSSCVLNRHAAKAYKEDPAMYKAGVLWSVRCFGGNASQYGLTLQTLVAPKDDEKFGAVAAVAMDAFARSYKASAVASTPTSDTAVGAARAAAAPPAAPPAAPAAPGPPTGTGPGRAYYNPGQPLSDFWQHYWCGGLRAGALSLPRDLDRVPQVAARDVAVMGSCFGGGGANGRSGSGTQDHCGICHDDDLDGGAARVATLPLCGHQYHEDCLDSWFALKAICPVCKLAYGTVMGTGPKDAACMTWSLVAQRCQAPTSQQCVGALMAGSGKQKQIDSINVNFVFGASKDDNGKYYAGRSETAILPLNEEGCTLLEFFKIAFQRRVMFGVGNRLQCGSYAPTFNVHIKTSCYGGAAGHGYPDAGYFQRTIDELVANHVTWRDLEARWPWLRGTTFGKAWLPALVAQAPPPPPAIHTAVSPAQHTATQAAAAMPAAGTASPKKAMLAQNAAGATPAAGTKRHAGDSDDDGAVTPPPAKKAKPAAKKASPKKAAPKKAAPKKAAPKKAAPKKAAPKKGGRMSAAAAADTADLARILCIPHTDAAGMIAVHKTIQAALDAHFAAKYGV